MRSFDGPLSPYLTGIAARAQREKKRCFDNLFSLITPEVLFWSYQQLRRQSSAGVDGVTWTDYGEDLFNNIQSLFARLVSDTYRAPNVRRTYIPKGNGKQRPLGIPTLEDKIVQRAVTEIVQAIYEEDFLPCSYGYRPNIGALDAQSDLGAEFQHGIYGYVVEADISKFFDQIDHDWLMRMLAERIADANLLRLIRKWLQAGIFEPDGHVVHPRSGSPQGGVISPLLANIYLHYVLDLWFVKVKKRSYRGRSFLIRYADDFVAGFQHQWEAEDFLKTLSPRLAKFNLAVEPSKTGMHIFSRFHVHDGGSFDFLGFTFRWQLSRSQRPHVSRQTSRTKFRTSVRAFNDWIRTARNWPRKIFFPALRRRLRGYANYYGVSGNSFKLEQMWHQVYLSCFKWLNRRSQRQSYTMAGLTAAMHSFGIAKFCVGSHRRDTNKPFLWCIV
jgi:group II intron reverse transcriptase/maturase